MATIDLKVGYSCNDACIHCVVDDFRDSLKEKHLKQDKSLAEITEEMTAARCRGDLLVVTGGEPTIRPDFWEILTCAKELGYRIMLQSNGRAFSKYEFAEKLKDFRSIISFCIALHGHTAEIHDTVTQRPGSFAETVQGLKNIHSLGFVFGNKIVISKYNYAILPQLCEKLAELHSSRADIAYPHAVGRAGKFWEKVVPAYSDIAPFVARAVKVLENAGISIGLETFPFCMAEGGEQYIGELQQQMQTYAEINQYGSDAGIENWSKLRLSIKRKFPRCRGCRFNLLCEGPWSEYALKCGGEEFKPVYGERCGDVRHVMSGKHRIEFQEAGLFF
ncbi:radical SAM protein [bacterium]|nr:radical SAM protein [bacterium]